MEAFTNALYNPASWIHSTPETVQQSGQDASQMAQPSTQNSHTVDDWNKDRLSQNTIDLNDASYGLADIQAPSTGSSGSSSMTPVQQYYSTFSQGLSQGGHQYYAPYNIVAYGQTPWISQPLPLSSYSTLNGATSSTGQSSLRQSPAPTTIDPALTVNGNASSSNQIYSPPPSASQARSTSGPTFINHFQHPQPPPSTINPMFIQQQQQQQQRTLSPAQLHSPTSVMGIVPFYYPMQASSPPPPQTSAVTQPVQTNLTASVSSVSPTSTTTPGIPAPAPAPEPSLAARKAKFQAILKILLSPSPPFPSSTSVVRSLVTAIDDFGSADIDPAIRVEIASKIRDNAGNQFFRAWSESSDAMDILREWLKAGATGKDDGHWEETIMPLLHVIDRLPLTIEQLKQVKLGKIILKLTKDPPSPAVKDMASNIERKWRQLMSTSEQPKKTELIIEDKTKKRKLSESGTKSLPPVKKVAIASSSKPSITTVKKETKVVTAVKDAKTDASFFSTPKPKPKLPSFKKAPPPPATSIVQKKEPDTSAPALGSALDPFQEALRMMKSRNMSPSQSTPEPAGSTSVAAVTSTVSSTDSAGKVLKKRKSVSWAEGSQLEQIKLIERAIYDDDPADGMHTAHSIRDLERGEGAALHAHLFEEVIDWYEPSLIEVPEDITGAVRPRGEGSQQKEIQEEREKNTLGALYISAAQIPDSPAEPSGQIMIEQVDLEVKSMRAGVEIQPFFQQAMSVSDLVGQLRSTDVMATGPGEHLGMNGTGVSDMTMGDTTAQAAASALQSIDLRKLGLDPGALSLLAQQLATQYGLNPSDPSVQNQQNWNFGNSQNASASSSGGSYNDYGYDERGHDRDREHDERGRNHERGSWRGGRGRGTGGPRGRGGEFKGRRKPCTFFAQGRCKFGDACDFSHEQTLFY